MSCDSVSDLAAHVERLNGLLRSGLSLAVVVGRRRRVREIVLALVDERGNRREAARRLRLAPGSRSLQLALSECFAECAMDLGLGASVCGGSIRNRLEPQRPSCENA